jgi:hypothetical protein
VPYGVGLVAEGEKQSAADLWVRGAGASIETSSVSCCSWHAADPLLADKDEKQEAKKDEHEAEQHGVPNRYGCRPGTMPGDQQANRRPVPLSRAPAPGRRSLDIFTRVHNNPPMNAVALNPAPVLIDLACSRGATG